jgi:hypothetical protein
MAGNSNLAKAKDARQDEFYTQLSDIENELRHYRKHFKGKTVLCNCDDPFESNFFKYFALNFNRLGLKKLMATCYDGSPIMGTLFDAFEERENPKTAYKAVVTTVHDATGNNAVEMEDVAELFRIGENSIERLEGNGDFRSAECLELLDEADIVVTNPPFSLFREFVSTLVEHDKSFVVIGGDKGRKYAEIFPLIKENKLWLGMTHPKKFFVPGSYQNASVKTDEDGRRYMAMGNVCWYTNLDVKKRHEEMILFKRYESEAYPSYTNFNGIDVAHVNDIPYDFPGNMGVPINFLDQYNPEQFEIVGLGEGNLAKEAGVTKNARGRTDLEVDDPGSGLRRPFARIIIRNLHPEQPKGA